MNPRTEIQGNINNLDVAKLCPVQIDDGGAIKKVDNFLGLYNVSQGKLATIVSKGYNVVQHKEYFNEFLDALDRLGIQYNADVKDLNNKAFLDIEFVDKNLKFKKLNEEFTTGIRLSNSYDKTTGLGIIPIYKRLACMNGMVLSRAGTTMVCKHNSILSREVEKFITTRLNSVINQSDYLQQMISESMKDTTEWKIAVKIITELIKTDKHREEILKRLGISVVKPKISFEIGEKPKETTYLFDNEKAAKLTRWEIYNAITNYCTFDTSLSTQMEMSLQKKAERIFSSKLEAMPLAEIKI